MEDDSRHDAYAELFSSLEDLHVYDLRQSCRLHGRILKSVCFTCDKAMCLDCLEACRKATHNAALVTDESFKSALQNLRSEMNTKLKTLAETSSVLQLGNSRPNQLRFLRGRQLEKIRQAKRHIVDELDRVVLKNEKWVNSMFDSLEKEAEDSIALSKRLEEHLMPFQNYAEIIMSSFSSLDLWRTKAIVFQRLSLWLEKLNHLKASLNDPKAVFVEASIPENLDYVLKFWIGNPQISTSKTFSLPRPRAIAGSSCYIEIPFQCFDVALTQDNNLLLAAGEQGLIECCSNGQTLSQWQPLKTPDGEDDSVDIVQVLSDGRAAVGVFCAKTIFLLRRNTGNSPSVTTWIEDQLYELRCPPRCLSVHGDVLAVGVWTFDEHHGEWNCGRQLQLIKISNDELLAATSRDYGICNIALTERAIITSSDKPLEKTSGCYAIFIDAHDRTTNLRLWRYELLDNLGRMHSIVADLTGRVLYASIDLPDYRGGRVAAISLRDGSELQQHVLSFNDFLRPRKLSLDNCRSIMAALCCESGSAENRMVTLHNFSPL